MSRLFNKKLKDSAQGKYMIPIWFTQDELNEVRRAVRDYHRTCNQNKKQPSKKEEHPLWGWRSQLLQNATHGLDEAAKHIKFANQAQIEGRWNKTHESSRRI